MLITRILIGKCGVIIIINFMNLMLSTLIINVNKRLLWLLTMNNANYMDCNKKKRFETFSDVHLTVRI